MTEDAFLGGALRILQPKEGYRAGVDAVLLAAALPAPGAGTIRVLDIGAGVGVVGLAVARRIPGALVTLVERDAVTAQLARANCERNGLSERVRVIEADLSRPLAELAALNAETETFDCVLANPPYHSEGRGTAAGDATKAAANAMPEGSLARWARFMAAMARPRGAAIVIHKAEALAEVLRALDGRFGALKVLAVHARPTTAATRVLVSGIKSSRGPLQVLPALTLHDAEGGFRPDIEAILRRGAALDMLGRPKGSSG
ncbi:MAG: methyltransferase [Hyphomicrobiaceae bacterium]|nr:MAG: methyltransferase [Hyphomicrobiaceae bacterium]